jgi:hypothetical protein
MQVDSKVLERQLTFVRKHNRFESPSTPDRPFLTHFDKGLNCWLRLRLNGNDRVIGEFLNDRCHCQRRFAQ